jgi:hypothetical protein
MGSTIHINKALTKTKDKNTKTAKASTTHSGKAAGKPSATQAQTQPAAQTTPGKQQTHKKQRTSPNPENTQ